MVFIAVSVNILTVKFELTFIDEALISNYPGVSINLTTLIHLPKLTVQLVIDDKICLYIVQFHVNQALFIHFIHFYSTDLDLFWQHFSKVSVVLRTMVVVKMEKLFASGHLIVKFWHYGWMMFKLVVNITYHVYFNLGDDLLA